MNKLTAIAVAITLGSAVSLNAMPILEIDATGAQYGQLSTFTESTYDPTSGPSEDISGWWGANILYTGDGASSFDVAWTLMGSESTYDNAAFADKAPGSLGDGGGFATNPLDGPNLLFVDPDNSSYSAGESIVRNYDNEEAGEAFGFEFVSDCVEGASNGCVGKSGAKNGENSPYVEPSFFISDVLTGNDGLSFVYLFFNDSGASSDRDFDDMILKMSETGVGTFSSVPEPATFALLGLALLGFRASRRKQRG